MDDKYRRAQQALDDSKRSPGPGSYNHEHYSSFFNADISPNDVHLLKQNSFTTGARDMPEYKKSPGIGDSTLLVGSTSYRPEGFMSDVKKK